MQHYEDNISLTNLFNNHWGSVTIMCQIFESSLWFVTTTSDFSVGIKIFLLENIGPILPNRNFINLNHTLNQSIEKKTSVLRKLFWQKDSSFKYHNILFQWLTQMFYTYLFGEKNHLLCRDKKYLVICTKRCITIWMDPRVPIISTSWLGSERTKLETQQSCASQEGSRVCQSE